MPIPTGGDTPSQYQPNPVDDRAMEGENSSIYLSLATAIEEIESIKTSPIWEGLDKGTLRGVKSAESALRRAAFSLVLHAPDPA